MNYGTTKAVLNAMTGLGWLVLLAGAYLIFSEELGAAGVIAGISMVPAGAIVIAIATMGLAQIETAETNSQILEVLKSMSGTPLPGATTASAGHAADGETADAAPGRIEKLGQSLGKRL